MDIDPKAWENISVEPNIEAIPDNLDNPPVIEKKRVLSLKKPAIFLVAILFITGIVLIFISKPKERKPKEEEQKPVNPIVIDQKPKDPYTTFTSEQYKFLVKFNSEKNDFHQRGAFSPNPAFFMFSSKENKPQSLDNEKELSEGYIVKISVFEKIDLNPQDLAERKMEKFKLECPKQSEISQIYATNLDNVKTASFEVKNCDQDYIVHFAEFEDFMYEIVQVYKGDIGFKQQYKSYTDEIINSIKWIRPPEIKHQTTILENKKFLIKITHPWLDTQCCNVTEPAIPGLEKIAVLAQSEDESGKAIPKEKITNKLGIFAVPKNNESFELFLNKQKQALIKEFQVVEGKNSVDTKETLVNLGNKEESQMGVKLEGYAWWGTVILVEHPYSNYFLIFVIPNGASLEFDGIVENILKDFVFLRPSDTAQE